MLPDCWEWQGLAHACCICWAGKGFRLGKGFRHKWAVNVRGEPFILLVHLLLMTILFMGCTEGRGTVLDGSLHSSFDRHDKQA